MKADTGRPRVVIVGAGFGGLQVARRLSGEAIDGHIRPSSWFSCASAVEVRLSSKARPVRQIEFKELIADVFRIFFAFCWPTIRSS